VQEVVIQSDFCHRPARDWLISRVAWQHLSQSLNAGAPESALWLHLIAASTSKSSRPIEQIPAKSDHQSPQALRRPRKHSAISVHPCASFCRRGISGRSRIFTGIVIVTAEAAEMARLTTTPREVPLTIERPSSPHRLRSSD